MAERHCIIHVGQPKTGTTAIQRTLARSLSDKNYDYAALESDNHSRVFRSVFTDWQASKGRLLDDFLAEIEEEAPIDRNHLLQEAVTKDPSRNLIFSAEAIMGFDEAELGKVHAFLREHFSDITIVAYIRRPRSHIPSLYQQRLKARPLLLKPTPLSRFYGRRLEIEKFDKIFGRDNVKLHLFDPAQFPSRDVVRHFFAANGLTEPAEITIANESLKQPAVKALYAFHKYQREDEGVRRLDLCRSVVAGWLGEVQGGKFALAANVIDPVVDLLGKQLDEIERRLGASLEEPVAALGGIGTDAEMLNFSAEEIDALETVVAQHATLPTLVGDRAQHAARLVQSLFGSAMERLKHKKKRRKDPDSAEARPRRAEGRGRRRERGERLRGGRTGA